MRLARFTWSDSLGQAHAACALAWRPSANCPSCTFSLASSGKSQPSFRTSRCRKRGASRSSRTLEAGCDGRSVLFDEQHDADGEVVWSWRPDAGASCCEMTQSDGDNKARSHRGEHEASRKTIAQGMPDVSADLWFCRVLFCCTRTMGAASTRHSLRPLFSMRVV